MLPFPRSRYLLLLALLDVSLQTNSQFPLSLMAQTLNHTSSFVPQSQLEFESELEPDRTYSISNFNEPQNPNPCHSPQLGSQNPNPCYSPQLGSHPPPRLLQPGLWLLHCRNRHGFRIYICDPFREIFWQDFGMRGGIGLVQMLFRCNILALIGGELDSQYPINKVMIWDDHQSRCIGELSFRSEVKGVRFRWDRIVVLLVQKIFVYNFTDVKLLHQIETIANLKGLYEVSHVSGSGGSCLPWPPKGEDSGRALWVEANQVHNGL